ncbi:MAG: hypothetical protein UT32_C0006G0008 [Parcubacteria group bacterium GW2011_GWC2_39_14]|nr:MAG: hypothetical protein UT32_C0006G0008 [Parcubacteria group bacterium GW2011_GWC2_39_14]KKR54796.1 MAG: hypothetical protein UT91_C0009G0008 [Parcubacteria group bacterium GW2011_GWA2_40_23]
MRYLVIALLLVVLSGCTLFTQVPNTVLPTNDEKVKAEEPQIQKAEDPLTRKFIPYTNKKYGFELKFPGEWEGYASGERVLDWGDLGKSDSIDYGFIKNKELESLFNISIHSVVQWKKIQASEGPVPTYLGEFEGLVLGWAGSQDASEANRVRRSQVDEIIASFKWIDQK